jgi:hypothetical protein
LVETTKATKLGYEENSAYLSMPPEDRFHLLYFLYAERVGKLREEKRTKRREVTLLRAPLHSLSIFALVMVQYAWQGLDYVRLHTKASASLAALALTLFVLNHTPGAHTEVRYSYVTSLC